jgi:dynein heavy chain
VLLKQTFKQGGQECLQIGDAVVPYHPDFKFYMTTKLRSPRYTPETAVKVTVLNFAITSDGLEQQLLAAVVQEERPDLEELKAKLVMQNAAMRKEMSQIEDKILELLSLSKGDILDDEELINTLSASKQTSEEISVKVAEAETTEKEIDETRLGYVPVAVRASILYFAISDMGLVDPMYQYSLGWFMNLFRQGVRNAPASTVLTERLHNLNEFFTYSLYTNVCRSLFERHKLLLSFLLFIRIRQGVDGIDASELKFLLTGPTSTVVDFPNPAPDWLTENMWIECTNLAKLSCFKDFHREVAQYLSGFQALFDSEQPQTMTLPGKWQDALNLFQRLLVLRCLRPDKCIDGIQNLVADAIGKRFIEPPPFDLPATYKDSTPATPLVFVLSQGADPKSDLDKFAEEMRFSRKLDSISLGQGQGPKAAQLIADATQRGAWVLLQNCHLATSWMPELEKICERINPEQVHRDYRLWLTSMPSKDFPVSILQDGVKMTNEPPKGLRANLNRTWLSFDDKFLETSEKPETWRQLLFGLTFLHAIVQVFLPLGVQSACASTQLRVLGACQALIAARPALVMCAPLLSA